MERIPELEELSEHFHHGARMSAGDAEHLEREVAAEPADAVGHMRLLGWATAALEGGRPGAPDLAERAGSHCRWLRETWLPSVSVPDPGARLMLGYVPLCARIDPGLAVAWIERARRDGWWGGEAWDRALSNVLLEWAELLEGDGRREKGEAALALLLPMLASGDYPTDRGSLGFGRLFRINLGNAFGKLLGRSDGGHGLAEELEDGLILKVDIAWAAFLAGRLEEARGSIEELDRAGEAEPDLRDRCHHHARSLEGELALAAGDRPAACAALALSVEGLRPDRSLAFLPSLVLARDLLAAGEKKVVIRHLEACARRWDAELRFLQEWATGLNTGERRRLPGMPLLEGA